MASPRTGSPRQPVVSPSLQHQALHQWGIMWYFSSWCWWCIIRSTILMELIGRFSKWVIQNSTTHMRRSWRETQFQNFTSRMYYYVTWDTFVFLQVSMPIWFGKRTIAGSLDISGSRKQWQYCRSISIGQTFDRTLGRTSNPALPASLPNHPSRSKASILRFLPLVDLGNPSPWITC